jgi:acyl-CoA dehydrogenase
MTSTKYLVTPQIQDLLDRIDLFIEDKLVPLQKSNDNERFFDHRREWARTDWDNHGLPRKDWEALLHKMERLADEAGFFRLPMPKELGGQECGNLVSELALSKNGRV